MKAIAAAALLVGLFAAVSPAEKRRPGVAQYVPPGFSPPEAGLPVALDVAGGRDKVYLQPAVDPANINLLWSVQPVGDAAMLVSRVNGMALDANAGRGNPYPRTADPSNVNHLWVLAKVGERYMIWSKVNGAVLDANGGRGRPYLSERPDVRNVNHLWELRPAGEYVMIVPAVRLPLELFDPIRSRW
jgi:hypothetical protein